MEVQALWDNSIGRYWRVADGEKRWTVHRRNGWRIINRQNHGVAADGPTGRRIIAAITAADFEVGVRTP